MKTKTENLKNGLLGFALWSKDYADLNAIKNKIEKRFDTEAIVDEENKAVSITIKEEVFVLTFMPHPVPNGDAEKDIELNYINADTQTAIKEHKGFFVVAKLKSDKFDPKESRLTFNKLCAVLMRETDAAAMYMGGINLLISNDLYIQYDDAVEQTKGKLFPVQLWMRILLYTEGDINCARTYGLNDFNLNEFCFYDTKKTADYLVSLLLNLSSNAIAGGSLPENGKTANFAAHHSAITKVDKEQKIMYFIEY